MPTPLEVMALDSGLAAIVSDRALPEALSGIEAVQSTRNHSDRAAPSRYALPGTVRAVHRAYIIFTLGSTGRPKGVEVRREGVAALRHRHPGPVRLR